ncbi:MAG TPA: tRNA epoxyqueuosine(34) reductase QueG, partial [Patescibacteria group bacterium]|nr:tRNA epoxyqueuosine(34) reductase QueG [Patescibacteria group bacterium]
MILNKEMGSFFFLGVIVTTLPLPPDEPALDQCGACMLCIEACPTQAIVEPRLVDSRRCLSYQTIELRGELPEEHRVDLGDRVFGCDDCQEVCPWNRGDGAPEPGESRHFPARPASTTPSLIDLLTMTHQQYLEIFRGSAVKRATWPGLRRNAAAALGNAASDGETLRLLQRVAQDPQDEPIVRDQAAWSADRIKRRLAGS